MNTCNKCGLLPQKCCCNDCGCKKSCCGKAKPVIDVQHLTDDLLTLSFNFNGVGTTYDYSSMIKAGETDTSLHADSIKRVLEYMAERHTDTISAKELGAILHIGDIGDVDIEDVDANSLFIYQKNTDCSRGCDGAENKWVGWSATGHLVDSFQYVMGYTDKGAPQTLNAPANTNQQWFLGWNSANKVSYFQAKEVSSAPVDSDEKKWRVYIDPTSKELVYVKEAS